MRWRQVHHGYVEWTGFCPPARTTSQEAKEGIECVVGSGVRDDKHAGGLVYAGNHDRSLIREGFTSEGDSIANMRHWTAISDGSLQAIGEEMKTPGKIPFGMLSENLVISGVPLSLIPSGTLLAFGYGGAVLAVWSQNEPCRQPEASILAHFGTTFRPAMTFARAARNRRGITGFVYQGGKIAKGDSVSALVAI